MGRSPIVNDFVLSVYSLSVNLPGINHTVVKQRPFLVCNLTLKISSSWSSLSAFNESNCEDGDMNGM
jgi:hypothetical protein